MKTCNVCRQIKELSAFGKRRSASDGLAYECKSCHSQRTLKYQADNKDKVNAKNRAWAERNRDKTRAASLSWVREHKDKVYADNKRWRLENKGKCAAYCRAYQAAKLQAVPRWLSEQHLQEMIAFYNNCPAGHEVDHIIPLQGEQVRGLHVPWNLQYLPAAVNRSKSNKVFYAPQQ